MTMKKTSQTNLRLSQIGVPS